MVSRTGMRSVEEHLTRILEAVEPLPAYDQPLLEALGLPLGEDVVAPIDLPNFDNSAVDGYAVRFDDVHTATDDEPVLLPVIGEVTAGQAGAYALPPRTSLRIMTGAAMPAGADTVVPLEWTDNGLVTVAISRSPKPGAYVRRYGEDLAKGDLVLAEGTVIGPRQAGLLAAVGRAQVRSRPRPRVVVLSTGNELCEPGATLTYDSVYDANSYLLSAAARSAGAIAYRVGVVGDDPSRFADALSDQLVRADLVITTGGVSEGAYDVVKEVLRPLGTVAFCDVAMQPGRPQGAGTIGEDATPILAFPGDPMAAYVSFEVFAVPAIRRMVGRARYRRPLVQATCTERLSTAADRRQFLGGRFQVGPHGATVSPSGRHGSQVLSDLARCNALIVVPEGATTVDAGSTVDVMVLDRDY